mgnify:CR=1 FL=1
MYKICQASNSPYWDERKVEVDPILKGLKRKLDPQEFKRLKDAGIPIREFLRGNKDE